MTQFEPDYLPTSAAVSSHKFVSEQGSELDTDMFSPAVLLLHPQVIQSLATKTKIAADLGDVDRGRHRQRRSDQKALSLDDKHERRG